MQAEKDTAEHPSFRAQFSGRSTGLWVLYQAGWLGARRRPQVSVCFVFKETPPRNFQLRHVQHLSANIAAPSFSMWASVLQSLLGKALAHSLRAANARLQSPKPHNTSKKAKQQPQAAKHMRFDRQTAFKLVCKGWCQAAGEALFFLRVVLPDVHADIMIAIFFQCQPAKCYTACSSSCFPLRGTWPNPCTLQSVLQSFTFGHQDSKNCKSWPVLAKL